MNIDIKTADGEEIELGGSYYDGRGTEHRVVGIRLIDYRHITKVSLSCLVGKVENLSCVLMRPNELYSTPPDSWEKLLEDLNDGANHSEYVSCFYFRKAECSCSSCEADRYSDCDQAVFKDIAARIHKLRGDGK